MKRPITILTLTLLTFCGMADELKQTIRGKVIDTDLKAPLPGASIVLLTAEQFTGTTTDMDGNFILKDVNVGRHALKITYMGYEPRTLNNVLVNAGKQVVLTVELRESVVQMEAVEVSAKVDKKRATNELALVSARGFTVEETQRYAGSLDDPGRMAQSYAGVNFGHDGSNELIIRGNNPRGVLWKMEGIEIPNPNHFSEQGATGGPISMLKGGVMTNSDFYTGAFPAEYGNAVSGVFDIKLRNGNSDQREYAFQAGVLGLEAAAEGGFKKGYEGSYLVNYRYSTLDFMKLIGFRIVGDQVPRFQDLSYKVHLPAGKAGTFSLFGLGGLSGITDEWDNGNDVFQTNLGITGLSHKLLLDKKTLWSTVVGVTGKRTHYFAEINDSARAATINDWDETFINQNVRVATTLNRKFNPRHAVKVGAIYSNMGYNMKSTHYDWENDFYVTDLDARGRTNLFQTFANWQYRIGDRITLNSGLHYLHFLLNNKNSFEPRLSAQYKLKPAHSISFGFGIHSRVEDPSVYLAKVDLPDGSSKLPNKYLAPWKSRHYVLGYDYSIGEHMRLKAEVYYQDVYDVPVVDDPSSWVSAVNFMQGYTSDQLVNNGTGTNYGLDLTVERFLHNDYYFLFTASVYDSKYKAMDGIERNSLYNSNYAFNYLVGKEWTIGNPANGNKLGVNTRIFHTGGLRMLSIKLDESRQAGHTVRDFENPFVEQAPDYFRADLMISFRRNKKKTTRIWKLDIQNVSNRQNVVQQYYNSETDQIENDTMLGLLPILSYRIEF